MNAMTCAQVEEQLDLLAAGACDRPTRRALERHLEACAACSASYAESRQLQGLLDLHWQEAARLDRLRRRLDAAAREAGRPRPLALPWVNRVASLAALLLVTFGLALLLPRGADDGQPGGELAVAAVLPPEPGAAAEMMPPRTMVAPAHADSLPRERINGKGITVPLAKARRGAVPLGLELKNDGARPLEVRLGGDDAELRLGVRGPGVRRVPVPADREEPAFLRPQTLWVAPFSRRELVLDRLVAGARGAVEHVDLTEPGDYVLTIHLTARVDRRPTVLKSGPIPIRVGGE